MQSPHPPLVGCVNKAGSLPSGRVMLSRTLKWYYGPLRLPTSPAATSSPYTLRLMLLFHHDIGSPALNRSSSATCHPCYPGRLRRPLPLSLPPGTGLPQTSIGSTPSFLINEATYGFNFVTACCFANWELTTPCYQSAAPLNYRGARTTPRTGL